MNTKRTMMTVVLALLMLTAGAQTSTKRIVENGNVYYQTYDEVAPEDILGAILSNYKGKTVLIDIWATWCGPCRSGHKLLAPMKKELKGRKIAYVYITAPTSPLDTWKEMIADIPGDHYYLTKEQYFAVLQKYESQGIPTYAIYNGKGQLTFKHIGMPDADVIKAKLLSALRP